MNLKNAAIIRMANATPERRLEMLAETNNSKGIIAKAKELIGPSPIDHEQNQKLEDLIAQLSLPEAKRKYGDAVELEE